NEDTRVGMRLAGVDGVLVKEPELAQKAINEAMNNPGEIAVVLLTEGVVAMCSEFVYDLKLNRKRPLIVEIPERGGNGRAKDSITRYVREAIGIKI
ncbi:MAG: V-type ATP synthase subunit F, partial [Acutalibacteraceae bacterium]|nr:V-type ATP synthase subunit F [Acutalibacteraceae bacterium]